MSFDIGIWIQQYIQTVKELFGERLVFVGLQGSYGRNEATADSDIDVVVILDEATVQDLRSYDDAISALPYRDKVCGFISGKQELMDWEKSDLFQFYHDTTPLYGSIDYLRPMLKKEDIRRAIRIGACNMYHMCGHNIVHEKDLGILKSLYKAAVFVVQAVYFERAGVYIKTKKELLTLLPPREQHILEASAKLKEQTQDIDFEQFSEPLFVWAGQLIREYGEHS